MKSGRIGGGAIARKAPVTGGAASHRGKPPWQVAVEVSW
jgi:hypothetical protein